MSAKRIVLKFGSGILTSPQGNALDKKQFARLASEISHLVKDGHSCLVVSSGAVAAGLDALGFKERPSELACRQACAAVGQSKLMRLYEGAFSKHDLSVAQLLLTHGDIDSRLRAANAKNTLNRLLGAGNVVPIINENDSVAVEELKFGDNDRLSAEVAMLAHADLLIILTSVDGLLDGEGNVVPQVRDLGAVNGFVRNEKGRLSVGGMVTKLEAVKLAVDHGIPTVIASGRKPGQIPAIVSGEPVGTRFLVKKAGKITRAGGKVVGK
jgi:glutamate 5-kinase